MVAPIFCVNDEGQVQALGTLVPVRPEGFVMVQADGAALHSDGLPWWLFDMRPQGYLGRAYASAHAAGRPAAQPQALARRRRPPGAARPWHTLPPAALSSAVDAGLWHEALLRAERFHALLSDCRGFSGRFLPCIGAIRRHIDEAGARIGRLG